MTTASHRVAVVGAGPAGIYFADALARLEPAVRIDVIERLPFPYGLVRYGVAADHQGTKAVTQILARAMKRPGVRYFGGVHVGGDVSLAELQSRYDAIVLATGAEAGRKLAFTGSDLPGNVTAYDFCRWLNGHPDCKGLLSRPVQSVAVAGHGNVALDVARILAKPIEELEKLDLADEGIRWLRSNRVREINVFGRNGAGATRFSPAELDELGQLAQFSPHVPPAAIAFPGEIQNPSALQVLRKFADQPARDGRRINFCFEREPTAFDGQTLTASGGMTVAADLIIHAVGQETPAGAAVSGGQQMFRVGWASGIARGTIQDSRTNAQDVAQSVAAWLREHEPRGDVRTLDNILLERALPFVGWQTWQQIDRSEVERGRLQGKLRHKFRSLAECSEMVPQTVQEPAS